MTHYLDQSKVEAFAGKMVSVLNGGSIALMASIGHKVELFDTMAGMEPATSAAIAEAARLNERYVREWLGAMVTGGIVDYDPAMKTYSLPAEHASLLTRAAGPGNLAAFAQTIPSLASVETGIVDSFRNGGGVRYDHHHDFLSVIGTYSGQVLDNLLISTVIPQMPDALAALENGTAVLDIGCGTGHSTNLMAQAFPDSQITAYDFREDALAEARAEAREMGLDNVQFISKDLATMDETGVYDLITGFDVIHDQAKPRVVLKAVHNALKPGCTFLMVDIRASSELHENMQHPTAPLLYTVSTMHCMTVSLALDGEGLGTAWGEQKALELLGEAGFSHVDVRQMEGDIFNNYYICRK
jgi:2-polyprenyl-3-methyl-5-hydroxy-6-metoxy-1,4-benzoquinol methylase